MEANITLVLIRHKRLYLVFIIGDEYMYYLNVKHIKYMVCIFT